MEASISIASVGVVRKAAQIRHSALLWTFSSGFVWVLVPTFTICVDVLLGTLEPCTR